MGDNLDLCAISRTLVLSLSLPPHLFAGLYCRARNFALAAALRAVD